MEKQEKKTGLNICFMKYGKTESNSFFKFLISLLNRNMEQTDNKQINSFFPISFGTRKLPGSTFMRHELQVKQKVDRGAPHPALE